MVVAIVCGLIIGLERESRGKPAGARTLVLICLGSAIFAKLSEMMAGIYGDPSRIAAQIVSGIGFLGAGAILQQSEKGYIAGLTTAATIWVTAAVGIVVGAGYYLYALISMVFIVASLRLIRSLERQLFHVRNLEKRIIRFQSNHGKTVWKIMGLLEDHMIHSNEYKIRSANGDEHSELELSYNRTNRNHRGFLSDVATMKSVTEIRSNS
ncbi:MAG: MgtC/SapB family protein [Bradymonadales bacterium]|nr:MAG: MgtC/SapB family protein [Bradymonadales bacterium]